MQNGGQRNSQGRDMSQRIEVCRAGSIAHPQPFLTCGFEARIVTLALCTQGVCSLETESATVNGKSVVCWNGLILGAALVFLPVIPVFVVTKANTGFGLTEWAAEFLPGTIIVGGFAIFVLSQSSITDQVTCRKSFALGIAFFEEDKSFPHHRPISRCCRCFSRRSPYPRERNIPAKGGSGWLRRGCQRQLWNP